MSFRLGTADNTRVVGSGFYAVTDNATSFTNFFLNHNTSTNGAAGTGFTTSNITATRSFTRVHFSAYMNVVSGTDLMVVIKGTVASSGFSLKEGSGFTIIRVA
jgi:hypothetical protein